MYLDKLVNDKVPLVLIDRCMDTVTLPTASDLMMVFEAMITYKIQISAVISTDIYSYDYL